jgi:hypothetical protein
MINSRIINISLFYDQLFHWVDKMFLRENLHDFVSNKREMFFLQYALAVKQKEIEKLEKSVQVRNIPRPDH